MEHRLTARATTAPPSEPPASSVRPASAVVKTVPDFSAVYAAEFDFVWRCLRALGVATADLDDAAQEVFVILHRRLANLRDPNDLRGWIYGVVRNIAANHKRGTRRKLASVNALERQPIPTSSTPLDNTLALEAATSLERFLHTLDSEKREVFVLAEIEEWTIPEVAKVVGVPLNTAYTRLRAARLEFERFIAGRRSHDERV
jgi:RNA polymerase sigma-70 factor (ECF subfamily)